MGFLRLSSARWGVGVLTVATLRRSRGVVVRRVPYLRGGDVSTPRMRRRRVLLYSPAHERRQLGGQRSPRVFRSRPLAGALHWFITGSSRAPGREWAETALDAAIRRHRPDGTSETRLYAHFESPEQIVQAVVAETFTTLRSHLDQARERARGPRARVVANCRAYVAFGAKQPVLYAVLFSRPRPAPVGRLTREYHGLGSERPRRGHERDRRPRAGDLAGAEVFSHLVQDSPRRSPTDPPPPTTPWSPRPNCRQ
jgi:AcrR family transcriptional regulator